MDGLVNSASNKTHKGPANGTGTNSDSNFQGLNQLCFTLCWDAEKDFLFFNL